MSWFCGVARMLIVGAGILAVSAMVAPPRATAAAKWRYTRTGSPSDVAVVPRAGYALMGGGAKQDPAFHFLCERTNGGDFLILRANTDEAVARGAFGAPTMFVGNEMFFGQDRLDFVRDALG